MGRTSLNLREEERKGKKGGWVQSKESTSRTSVSPQAKMGHQRSSLSPRMGLSVPCDRSEK